MSLSIGEKIGYGLGDTASNFVWSLTMNFIMFYYTDIFGISAAAAGTILLVSRCTDGIGDFFIGALADRTRTRWGRFRPYLLWGCVPLGVVFLLTFTTPDLDPGHKLVWAWTTYNLLMLFYSAINIPYGALSGVMTDDPLDRTSLNSYRMGLAQVGGIIANSSFLLLVRELGAGDDQRGTQLTALLFSTAAIVLFLVSFHVTRERIEAPTVRKTRLREDLRMLLANRHWRMLFAAGVLTLTFVVMRGTAGIYYLKNYLKWDDGRIGTYFLVSGLAVISGAIFTKYAVRWVGRKSAFIASLAVVGLSALPIYWLAPHETAGVFAFQILGMAAGGINATLYWALVADAADFAEWKYEVRATGIVFSAITTSQKAGMGIGAAAAGALLTHFGYVPQAEQSAGSIHGILLLNSLIPAAGLLLPAGLFIFYGLDDATCRRMRTDLTARRLTAG